MLIKVQLYSFFLSSSPNHQFSQNDDRKTVKISKLKRRTTRKSMNMFPLWTDFKCICICVKMILFFYRRWSSFCFCLNNLSFSYFLLHQQKSFWLISGLQSVVQRQTVSIRWKVSQSYAAASTGIFRDRRSFRSKDLMSKETMEELRN